MGQDVTIRNITPPARADDVSWTQALISEGDTATGPWTVRDTLPIDEPDTDPSNPAARSFTTTNGTAPYLWYTITFLTDAGGTSLPSAPIQNVDPAASTDLLATTAELAARLGISFVEDEEDRVAILIGLASGLVRRATRQTISVVTDDVLTMRGTYASRVTLPQRPVVDVTSVTVNGVELADGSWYLDGNDIVRTSNTGGFWIGSGYGGSFGCPRDELQVTYTHGFGDPPEEVKATVLEAVARVFVNPAVTTRETNGSSDVMYAPSNGLLLTAAERSTVCDALRRQAASIALR